ncbi:MAG: hypothetical protein HYY17_15435 [Planctomycetes bacterium]|nr:hypothetical protein [Planctomycetota bacterium]
MRGFARWWWSLGVVAAALVFVSIELMLGYWRGSLPYAETTGPVYWAHLFGR